MTHASWARPTILTLMFVVAISACLLAAIVQGDGQLVVIIVAGLLELGVSRLMVPVRIPSNETS